jgi:serine/threonine-protein kinase RsbW
MPIVHDTLQVAGTLEDFERAARDLRARLDAWGVTGSARRRVELVFEEIVTNVIRHAYTHDPARSVAVSITCGADRIVLVFDDDGPPFNPLARPEPARPSSLAAAREGGLGILMVRKAAATVEYERTQTGRNRLAIALER